MIPTAEDDASMEPTEGDARPGCWRATWHGARAGAWWTSRVTWPAFVTIVALSLHLTSFAAGSGRGWGLPPSIPLAFMIVLACQASGGVVGALVGMTRSRRAISGTPPWWPRLIPASSAVRWVLGSTLAVTLAAAFGGGIYAGREVDRRLQAAIAAADLDDPSWRIDDMMAKRPAVPDAENSGLAVLKVIKLLPDFWPDILDLGDPPAKTPPDDINEPFDRLEKTPDTARLDPAVADRLRREIQARGEAVRVARTIADMDRGRYETVLDRILFDTRLPHIQATRDAAKLMQVDAAIRAEDGDLDAAVDSCRAVIGVARSFGDDPFMVSQIVRIRLDEVALASLRRIMAQGEPSDAALGRLQALALDELSQPLMLHAARDERASLDELIRRIRTGEMAPSELGGNNSSGSPAPREPVSPWGKLVLDYQRAAGLEWTNQMVVIARRPPIDRPPMVEALRLELDRAKQSRFSGTTMTLPLLMAPMMVSFASIESRWRCELGATVILIAAERHRRKTGAWPESVAAIDPNLLPRPPLDPFTDRPYLIDRRGGEIIVHSVGPNLRDDHGESPRRGNFEPESATRPDVDDFGVSAWDVPLRRRPPEPAPGTSP